MTGEPLHGSLSAELRDRRSPVRRFFTSRFGAGLRGVQKRYRESVPELAVPYRGAAPGTVAVAARWLLRFILHPAPDLDLVLAGVRSCQAARLDVAAAAGEVIQRLGMTAPLAPAPVQRFTGPGAGSPAEPCLLARACWCFALLTEAYRGGTGALRARSPLRRYALLVLDLRAEAMRVRDRTLKRRGATRRSRRQCGKDSVQRSVAKAVAHRFDELAELVDERERLRVL